MLEVKMLEVKMLEVITEVEVEVITVVEVEIIKELEVIKEVTNQAEEQTILIHI
tara:strand:- start:558 stop:719 length:162 start_codon:yes stop_codon:yes gene_type:complete